MEGGRIVLDLNKYINIEEKDIEVGMNASGKWYCKSLKAKDIKEAGEKMLNMNVKLNLANMPDNGDKPGKKN